MTISYSLLEIVEQLGGRVLGDADKRVCNVAAIHNAQSQHISFLTNSKYRSQLSGTTAGAMILGEADANATDLPRIISDNPYAYFAKVSALLNPVPVLKAGVHASAVVSDSAQVDPSAHVAAHAVIAEGAIVGANSVIGEGCYVGANVVIGKNARLYPRVVIYYGCEIGDNFIAHSGVVIGADGFGIAMDQGRWIKIPQIGRVVIGHDVEVGANTTIDRGAISDTVIEDGVKMDNQIQIAHNVHIGAHTAIAGCAAMAGSAVIGKYCLIGGSARILGHLTIADRVEISANSFVAKSIREAGSYTGIYPLSKMDEWRKNAVHLRHLDEMSKRIKQLEKQIEALTQAQQT